MIYDSYNNSIEDKGFNHGRSDDLFYTNGSSNVVIESNRNNYNSSKNNSVKVTDFGSLQNNFKDGNISTRRNEKVN